MAIFTNGLKSEMWIRFYSEDLSISHGYSIPAGESIEIPSEAKYFSLRYYSSDEFTYSVATINGGTYQATELETTAPVLDEAEEYILTAMSDAVDPYTYFAIPTAPSGYSILGRLEEVVGYNVTVQNSNNSQYDIPMTITFNYTDGTASSENISFSAYSGWSDYRYYYNVVSYMVTRLDTVDLEGDTSYSYSLSNSDGTIIELNTLYTLSHQDNITFIATQVY